MSITLRAARVNLGLNQKEAANLIGVSLSTLQNYEAGKSYPDVPIIERIEKVYGVKYGELIFFAVGRHFKRQMKGGTHGRY